MPNSKQPPATESSPTASPHVFQATIDNCSREPIHIPGSIQPHGAFLAVLADNHLVSHASANLPTILGCPIELALGQPLDVILGSAASEALLKVDGGLGLKPTQILQRPDGSTLHLRAFRSGKYICLDIEPMVVEPLNRSPVVLVQGVLKSFEHAASAVELCKLAVVGLKAIGGYDRVMAYRFIRSGDGEVVAEAREERLEPFLGLHYPASDIPQQARQLYLRQRVGAIADARYAPVPLLSYAALDDGSPLDLTHSVLRSVSPVHLEYMRNMNTAASLTIGLAQGNELWGMLVCHHATVRAAGPALRAAAGTIGQVVSLLLQGLAEAERLGQRLVRGIELARLVEAMAEPVPLSQSLAAAQADLLHLVDATGAVLRFAGEHSFLGSTPPPAAALRALDRLLAQASGEVLAIDDLGQRVPELADCTSLGSGALLLPLAMVGDDAILWFRPELSRTVTWAGNPAVHASVDPETARISPRASFKAWEETVRGRSAPWTPVDTTLAREFRQAVQAELVRLSRAALLESEARLGLLAEHSGVVVALTDSHSVRKYVSPAAERVLGWSAQELVNRSALDFIHPEDHQLFHDAIQAMHGENGESSVTYRFRRPDGSWLWVDRHAWPRPELDERGGMNYVVVMRDATQRKAAEDKLVETLNRMEQMAATDGLTGLANRRHLEVAAEREWRRCAREAQPLSVLMVDADKFKLFNDQYGHLAGDDCLRAVAGQLAKLTERSGDLCVRYGGEEFLVLLPNTDLEGALSLAEMLCRKVNDMNLPHARNVGFGVVTVSVGAATTRPGIAKPRHASMSDLVAAADAALYRAKSNGRNQVVADSDTLGAVEVA